MRYEFNVSGETRKALVKTISEFTGQKAKYNGVPTCSLNIITLGSTPSHA